jgi:glycerate kinase
MLTSQRSVVAVAQAFKETLDLASVVGAMERGIRLAGLAPRVIAGSDGGDGLLDALTGEVTRRTRHRVAGPLGSPIDVPAAWLDRDTAVVESRLVCGLSLLRPEERDPRRTTTRGLGELLDRLASEGAGRILVGLGGSATMDGGTGMARAWGWKFLRSHGQLLPEGGGDLPELVQIRPGRAPAARITALVDVRHVLTGSNGAMQFAEQKGATPDMAARLNVGLARLAELVEGGPALAGRAGAGAAGGLGFGLLAFARADLASGASWILERRGFDGLLRGAVAVVAGEGRFDATSLGGKLTGEVLSRAAAAGIPGVLVAPEVTVEPPGRVVVETGGGTWNAAALEQRVAAGVARAASLSPR